jgi:Tfp pilus assembly protein PilN
VSTAVQDIDFLPSKYREASAQRRTRYYRLLVVVAFVGLLGAAFAGQYALQIHVARELDHVRDQYQRVLGYSNRLAQLERERVPCDAEAQLCTRLRDPWPRTQILAATLAVLPKQMTLLRLRIDRQTAAVDPLQAGTIQTGPAPGAANGDDKLPPAQRDLRRLRQDSKLHDTVVDLEGITDDALTLHTYLGRLASQGLFSSAELTSIDRVEKSSMSHFRARLTVRREHADSPAAPAVPLANVSATEPTQGTSR